MTDTTTLTLLVKASPQAAVMFAAMHGLEPIEVRPLEKWGETVVIANGSIAAAAAWFIEDREPPFKAGSLLWYGTNTKEVN